MSSGAQLFKPSKQESVRAFVEAIVTLPELRELDRCHTTEWAADVAAALAAAMPQLKVLFSTPPGSPGVLGTWYLMKLTEAD